MSNTQQQQEVNYNKNTPLERVFHNATARILDFLIVSPKFDYSASQLSKISGIPLRTTHRILPNLVETQLVSSRQVGKMNMYKINEEFELAKILKQYSQSYVNMNIEKAKKIAT